MNTRRYHGLLVAALQPPVGRYVLLSKLEERLLFDGRAVDLSSNLYPGCTHPLGYRHLTQFRLDPFPVITWEVDGVTLEKRIFLVQRENTVVVEYELTGGAFRCSLELRPLIAFREFHSLTHANPALNPEVTRDDGLASIQPYGSLPRLYFAHNATSVEDAGHWYYSLEYPRERERGLDDHEDLFCPLVARFELTRDTPATLIASTSAHRATDAAEMRRAEVERRAAVHSGNPLVDTLSAAASQFLVERGEFESVIAGYHWFSDWGRDTMIALPGLTLATGRLDDARRILLAFASSVDQGMIPNRFPDAGEQPEYNTADATLWFVEAARSYVERSGDLEFARMIYGAMQEILEWHIRGTRYGIHLDEDGLLAAGSPGAQVTWMDSKIGDWVVTPRHGKPVEIQALWYNALRVIAGFAAVAGDRDTGAMASEIAARAKSRFEPLFWNAGAGCFYDVIDGDTRDASIRPNQVIAMSLRHGMVSQERARQALAVVERDLLTPFGLRTLAPGDPRYRGRYEGGPAERDAVYHQGTVWPWLLGPFLTAYVKAWDRTDEARQRAAGWLAAFEPHLHTAGLGQISEIFDGDAPHEPRGCVAQAWSVAEVLRVLVEDLTPN